MLKKLIPIILFISLTATFSNAQILNIEKFRLSSDTFNVFLGNIDFGYSVKKQVNKIQNFRFGTKTAYLSKKHSYILISKLNVETINKADIVNAGYIHYRMNFWRKKPLSLEQFNQVQYDAGRNLDERWVFGTSGRFQLTKKDKSNFSVNTGLMYENEHWNNDTITLQNESIKWTTHFTVKQKLHKNIYLYSITFYQAKLNSTLQPRLITDTSIKFKISTKLSFQSSYIATLDSAPIVDIARYTYTIENKFVYKF